MPNWSDVLKDIEREEKKAKAADRRRPSSSDAVRRRYLKKLHEYTERNVISYYSGWLMRSDNLLRLVRALASARLKLLSFLWFQRHTVALHMPILPALMYGKNLSPKNATLHM